jgi:hypothetical protein
MNITGTFLDENTHDIPSNNWGRKEWAEDFRVIEFSHFMSPHSCWPAAKNLFDRYCEYCTSLEQESEG